VCIAHSFVNVVFFLYIYLNCISKNDSPRKDDGIKHPDRTKLFNILINVVILMASK